MTTIAFVENHIGFRRILSQYLESQANNYKVYHYDNGKDFVVRFPSQEYIPAIVLMDIRMPEMNGYETTAWLKKNYPTIPVLIFSDIERPDAIALLIRCGANGYTSNRANAYNFT